jgi:hypothetical protein
MDFANGRYWYNGQSWVAQENASGILAALGGTFTRASTAYYTNSAGLLASAASGALRFDYDPATLLPRGILLEGARTNLCLQSQVLGTTWSPTNLTVGDNTEVAPDGTTTAETLTATAANGTLIQDLGVIASAEKVFSIWLKRKTGTGNIDMTLNGGTGWTTKTITSSWARYEISATLADPDVGIRIVTSGDEVYAWGGQCEAALFPSSYIPTTTGSVTRAADALEIALGAWFNTSVGGVLISGDYLTTGTSTGLFQIDDTTANNRIAARVVTDPGIDTFVIAGGVAQQQSGAIAGSPAANALYKLGKTWAANDFADVVNGGTPVTDASGSIPTGLTRLVFSVAAAFPQPYGHVQQFAYWPIRASNAELQRLTTP